MKPIIGIITNCIEAHEFKGQRIRGVAGQNMYISSMDYPESYFHSKKPYIFAVQWHPEMMANIHKKQLKVFELFIDYAANKINE